MIRPVLLILLVGCSGGPASPSEPIQEVCDLSDDVVIERLSRIRPVVGPYFCVDYLRAGEVLGDCETWEPYNEVVRVDDSGATGSCAPIPYPFTEVATGDCLFAVMDCFLDVSDPRYTDCSASSFPDCCRFAEGETYVWPPVCRVQ